MRSGIELVPKGEGQAPPAVRLQRQWWGGLGMWAERGLVQMETWTADTVDCGGQRMVPDRGFSAGKGYISLFSSMTVEGAREPPERREAGRAQAAPAQMGVSGH